MGTFKVECRAGGQEGRGASSADPDRRRCEGSKNATVPICCLHPGPDHSPTHSNTAPCVPMVMHNQARFAALRLLLCLLWRVCRGIGAGAGNDGCYCAAVMCCQWVPRPGWKTLPHPPAFLSESYIATPPLEFRCFYEKWRVRKIWL